MSFMLGGKQTVKKPLSIFINWSHYLPAIIGFGSIHRLLPSLWISACTPYIISLCFIPMHDSYCKQWNWTCRAKEMSLAWQYNFMQTSLHGRRKGSPPPPISDCNREEDICSEGDSEGEDNSYLPPEVFALTWHADVAYIMHMVSCIAYFVHQICHLLSLDILCANAICLVYSSFMWIMQRHLV